MFTLNIPRQLVKLHRVGQTNNCPVNIPKKKTYHQQSTHSMYNWHTHNEGLTNTAQFVQRTF